MSATRPSKIIGTIDAIRTLTENFPVSVLDAVQGTTYTSIFMFLIDVLQACNVNIYDIASWLLEKVYGLGVKLDGGIATIYSSIDKIDINEQSKLLQIIEEGMKGIILALLTSIFTCSANPVIPNTYLDNGIGHDDEAKFKDYMNNPLFNTDSIDIPIGLLDFFGHLRVNPFSDEGKMYFSVEGGDKFYEKRTQKVVVGYDGTENPQSKRTALYEKIVKLYVDFGFGHETAINEYKDYQEDEIVFKLSEPIGEPLTIKVNYTDSDRNARVAELEMRPGETVSNMLIISPTSPIAQKEYITNISIKATGGYTTGSINTIDGSKTYLYLDKDSSMEVINYWNSVGNNSFSSVVWGNSNSAYWDEPIDDFVDDTEIEVSYYEEVERREGEDAIRVSELPTNPSEDDPEYIVHYTGLDPNTIYRTNDMDAFLWYIVNRSGIEPQYEENKNVWDSRFSAKKKEVEREDAAQWNVWLNSKDNEYGKLSTGDDEKDKDIYPILHLEKSLRGVSASFPAQRYFKPTRKDEDSDFVYEHLRFNSTLYQFNYEYLHNIQILKPKVILYGMVDALLNGAMSAFLSVRPNFTKKRNETILSTAIKKYIEAEDAEVEDCYFTFSNDEFDAMLNEMLLSRYNATYSGGETHLTATHDINDYVSKLDTVNFSSTAEGDITKINKIVTEVSASAGREGSIEYGIEFNFDKNFWNRLIWAITLPIIESIFTPKVILLFLINFRIMGIMSFDDLLNNDQSKIITLITNKIFALVRSIISFIKDKIAELLFELFSEKILPMLVDYNLLIMRERMDAWIALLASALRCLSLFRFNRELGSIDDVDYADIIKDQNRPESKNEC